MTKIVLDTKGLRCPMPALKMTSALTKKTVSPGDVLEVLADCPSFENDVKAWCAMYKKVLVLMRDEGNGVKRCQVQI
jgi:tRNA 2-thiouridine synthesizing protein A